MKVLIATPSFDGNVKLGYHHSLLETIPYLTRAGVGFSLINEARNLINQARNRSAHYAINNGFDKLLFIDSDIKWKPEHVMELLKSDKKIVGGVYPVKAYPIRLNFVPLQNIGLPENFDGQWFIDTHADKTTGEVEVHMLATGFLMIDVSVFKDLDPVAEKYHTRDPIKGTTEHEKMYFPFNITKEGFLNTEDWGFCDLARSVGHKIYWNTRVIVDHIGSHLYSATTPIDETYTKLEVTDKPKLVDNPYAQWPENLVCYCGTGKKFKHCHSGKVNSQVSEKEREVLVKDFDGMLKYIKDLQSKGKPYKLDQPLL